MDQKKRNKLISIFKCPECGCADGSQEYLSDRQTIKCSVCGKECDLSERLVCLAPKTVGDNHEADFLACSKEFFKKILNSLYPLGIKIFSPVCSITLRELTGFLKKVDPSEQIICELGSGCSRYHSDIINVDLEDYAGVDVQASVDELPFVDESVDGIISLAVLEHVKDIHKAIAEYHRILKTGGESFCLIPFMQGIHASPSDYSRYTDDGLRNLFNIFSEVRVIPSGGPTSAFLWIFQEWFAMTFSFGSKFLYWFLYMLLFSIMPLKFIDKLLVKHPQARNIASSFLIFAKK